MAPPAAPTLQPDPLELSIHHGRTWTEGQFADAFEVEFVQRGIVLARQRSDGAVGSLYFGGSPRVYFGWLPHPPSTERVGLNQARRRRHPARPAGRPSVAGDRAWPGRRPALPSSSSTHSTS